MNAKLMCVNICIDDYASTHPKSELPSNAYKEIDAIEQNHAADVARMKEDTIKAFQEIKRLEYEKHKQSDRLESMGRDFCSCKAALETTELNLLSETKRLTAELTRYKALHEAELGMCEEHCDVVKELTAERDAAVEKYNDLIMSVSRKYEGETRHDTAKKYINRCECENEPSNGISAARQAQEKNNE
jgi:hypothetical protein